MSRLPLLLLLLCVAGLRRAAAGKTLRYFTVEEDPPGTVIGTLADDLPAAKAAGGERSFRLLRQAAGNGSRSRVEVRERDGRLSVGAERLDREALCAPSEAPCVLAFDVVSLGGRRGAAPHFGLVHVELEVRDINDHAPRFPQAEVALEVSESAAPGTRLPLPLPHDPDAGANGVQSFALAPPHGPFGLEAQSRADGRRCAELVLLSALDREAQAAYRLELLAKDGGSPARSGTATLRVRVLDANDHAPAFPRGPLLTVELPEDAPPGAPLLDLDAADPDEGANGQLLYSWGSQVPAEARARFALDAATGRLSLRAALDYERQRAYELDVQASDRGASPLAATCKVLVRLLDVNDNAPTLAISALSAPPPEQETPAAAATDAPGLLAYVSEAAPPESLVALVSASDADSGANGQVRVALLPAPQLPFALQRAYEASYALLTAGPLDRERVPEYNLTLVAEDLGTPPAKTVRHLTVRLADENDNPPRFARPRAEIALPENNPPGAYLATLHASDPDLGPNGQVTYRLLDSQVMDASIATYVSVDPATGALYAVRTFNYEILKQLEVSIQATDGGSPPLSSTATVQVRVVDQNDNAPVITHPVLTNNSLQISVSSRASRDSLVTHIKARDADEGVNAELSFSLLQEPQQPQALDQFAINPKTGEISLARSLSDDQLGQTFCLLLAVTDGGRPPLSTTSTVSFLVTAEAPPSSSQEAPSQAGSSWEGKAVQWDVPLIVIVILAGSCTLLLVAIVTIATTCNKRKKEKGGALEEAALDSSPSLREKGRQEGKGGLPPASPPPSGFAVHAFPSKSSFASPQHSPASEDTPASENSQESTGLYDSQSRLREPHTIESYASTPSSSKEPGPPAAIWKGHSFSTISGREAEKFSGKDSGKGDSDFNDSDSDISGEALKRDLITHMQNGLWACTAECKILGHSDRCWSPSCGRPNPHLSHHPKAQLSTFCKSTSLPRESLRRDHFYQAQLPKTVGLQSVYEKVLHRDLERTLTLRSPPHPGRLPDLQEISVPLFQDSPAHYLGPSSDATQKV
ncbi:protocadherin-8 [Paroedura picta]|uniref:protocadherin-8 n=1 Tax=Paroedura picta TaxID=143630 RepID=UPI0010149935